MRQRATPLAHERLTQGKIARDSCNFRPRSSAVRPGDPILELLRRKPARDDVLTQFRDGLLAVSVSDALCG
jgi:hypothetical protein